MTSSVETPFRIIGVGVGPAGSGVSVGRDVAVMVGTGVGGIVGLAVGTDVVMASFGGVAPDDWPARMMGVALPPEVVVVGAGSSEGTRTARVGRGVREVQPADTTRRSPMNRVQCFARPDINSSIQAMEG